MDSGDGKEKGGITAARKGEEMKSLEKATADYEKAKEKMEASKARYEADLKRFKAAEIAKTEAENLSLAVSSECPAEPLATGDKGCARCGT